MFFTRKQTVIVEPQPKKAAVLVHKQVPPQPQPQQNSYYDMMEEALLQTIRSSSMALLDLYKRRGDAPKMLPPPELPKYTEPPKYTELPKYTEPPKYIEPPKPKKIHLEKNNIAVVGDKILNEIDDLLDENSFSEKAIKEILRQSLTWNTVASKIDSESLSTLFKHIYETVMESAVDVKENILDELFNFFKSYKGEVNSEIFLKGLNKTASWNNLAPQAKKEILKPLYSSFSSRRADFMRDVYPVGKPSGSMSTGTPTNKNDGGNKGQGVQQLGSPSKYSPVNNYGISNLDKSEAYGRTPANNMNDIKEVQNAPGSSRVIPQNSGFVNNASDKAKKVSELTQAILNEEFETDEEISDEEIFSDEN